jgi:hypothetical protein
LFLSSTQMADANNSWLKITIFRHKEQLESWGWHWSVLIELVFGPWPNLFTFGLRGKHQLFICLLRLQDSTKYSKNSQQRFLFTFERFSMKIWNFCCIRRPSYLTGFEIWRSRTCKKEKMEIWHLHLQSVCLRALRSLAWSIKMGENHDVPRIHQEQVKPQFLLDFCPNKRQHGNTPP